VLTGDGPSQHHIHRLIDENKHPNQEFVFSLVVGTEHQIARCSFKQSVDKTERLFLFLFCSLKRHNKKTPLFYCLDRNLT
jgi:hypothetical protein